VASPMASPAWRSATTERSAPTTRRGYASPDTDGARHRSAGAVVRSGPAVDVAVA
jgi:hypothetical protein